VHHRDVEPPQRWTDLATLDADAPVAVPDPGFAGSALGALGYFAQDDEIGMAFYAALKDGGAVQVQAPDEVTTGVAEGRFSAGMTLDSSARTAAEKGSPVDLVAPEPGAIAIFSPIGVVAATQNPGAAAALVTFAVTPPAQEAIASTGWEPIRDDVDWPHDLPQVFPDWEAIAERSDELLEEYRAIFGG
jgi:iron(III) transport system substrate-binding protein